MHGRNANEPLAYSTYQRAYTKAFAAMKIKGHDCYDLRAMFAIELAERGLTSKQVAGLMGHADTRMVETVYAPTRKNSVLKLAGLLDEMNRIYAS